MTQLEYNTIIIIALEDHIEGLYSMTQLEYNTIIIIALEDHIEGLYSMTQLEYKAIIIIALEDHIEGLYLMTQLEYNTIIIIALEDLISKNSYRPCFKPNTYTIRSYLSINEIYLLLHIYIYIYIYILLFSTIIGDIMWTKAAIGRLWQCLLRDGLQSVTKSLFFLVPKAISTILI